MDLLEAVEEPLQDALPAIGQKSFPGMSADEGDAFKLGFYVGAMAYALITTEEVTAADEIAERVDAEIKRIELEGDDEAD